MPPVISDELELVLTIDNFKTMNRKIKEELLPIDIAYNCQNLRYDNVKGMIYKRPSRRKYNSTTLGSDPITAQIRYYKNSDDTKRYIIATSNLLQKGDDNAGTFSNIKTGLSVNKRFMFIVFKDRLYCFNGYDNNQVYDGTNTENMGVPVPSALTLALGGSGSLTGEYRYKVTYMIDSYQEGSASVASNSITPSSQSVVLTIPTSTNTRVTHRKIYRTKADGSIYYLLATIADNTTTSYGDNIADVSLGVVQAPTDYGVPASYRYAVLHKSRIFLARNSTNKSRIIFSDIRSGTAYPDVFPADNYFDIAKDDGDEITGIAVDPVGNLVVWKNNSVRILYTDGESPKGWSIGKPFTNFGNTAPYFLVNTPIGTIYMTRFGATKHRLMLWNGLGVKNILEEVDPILDGIDPAAIGNTIGHFHNGKIYISYTDTSVFPDISVDSYAKYLLHMDGASGSTTFTDDSNSPHTITANGSAQVSTSVYKFVSGSLLLNGTTDYLSSADSSDLDFGTEDFSLEAWVYPTEFNQSTDYRIISAGGNDEGANNLWSMGIGRGSGSTGHINFAVNNNAGNGHLNYNSDEFTFTINAWYHIAVVRNGSTLYFFINGILSGTATITANAINGGTSGLKIGARVGDGSTIMEYFKGNVDEMRISKGIARWTNSFIPPTTEYGYSYNNKVLIIDAATLSMINIDDKAIDSFSSWSSGTDLGELYSGTSNVDGFCYEEETDTNASESTIEIEYKWGKLNFGQPRLRKRLKQVKVEFDRDTASGTLSYFHSLDGASEVQVDIAFATYASQGYYIYHCPLNAYCFNAQPRLYSNSDIKSLGIKRLVYIYSLEPYYPLL